jgi:hypothetical protein
MTSQEETQAKYDVLLNIMARQDAASRQKRERRQMKPAKAA